jgi:hypothetical protein
MVMNSNSTELSPLTLQASLASSLRIAYRNEEIVEKKAAKPARKNKHVQSAAEVVVKTEVVAKEPLPMFNDYRIKARDYDPL